MVFLLLFAIPIIMTGIAYYFFHHELHFFELVAQLVITAIVAGSSSCIISHQNVADVEVWNGVTTGKTRDRVSCEHSYQCNPHDCGCTTDSKGSRSCSTCYDTCYDHSYDIDWNVRTTLGKITINRADRQGLVEPSRWTRSIPGEPVAITESYENPIKGASDTLFRHDGKRHYTFPAYPLDIYDYHYLNRLVSNKPVQNAQLWNELIQNTNSHLQRAKGNLIVFIAQGVPQDYANELESAWLGGKKNDVVVVIGTTDGQAIDWVHTFSWTTHTNLKVAIDDHVKDGGSLDDPRTLVKSMERDIIAMFEHRSMKDFEYLMSSVQPTTGQWIIALLVNIIIAAGMLYFFVTQDPFAVEGRSSWARYR